MPSKRVPDLDALEARFVGPRRVGLFGHRAVGKTTLLAMLYREASSGRIPGIRLAALEARGAEYLAEKIAAIEAGESPPGTLAETDLLLRLYRGISRVELLLKDYQGEHVGLGSDAPIQNFLADCDAVLFCLDPEGSSNSVDRRRRQQEVEQLLEKYLDASDSLATNRPIAVLITKYDQVLARGGPRPEEVEELVRNAYGMTRHALQSHAPRSVLFAVSSFGAASGPGGTPPADLRPMGFEEVLTWLAKQLEQSDREQLEWIWDLAPDDYPRLSRCVAVFAKRYPQSRKLIEYRRRLGRLRLRRLARSGIRAAVGAASLVGALAGYDAVGYHLALTHEKSQAPAASIAQRWSDFLVWHPTQPLFWPAESRQARAHRDDWRIKAAMEQAEVGLKPSDEIRADLDAIRTQAPRQSPAILQVEKTLQSREHDELWSDIKAQTILPSVPAPERLQMVERFVHTYQDSPNLDEAIKLASAIRDEIVEQDAGRDREQLEQIRLDSQLPEPDYVALIERTRQFLEDRPDSRLRDDARVLAQELASRLDTRDFEAAQNFEQVSADRDFALQIRKYQDYLRAHQDGGAYATQAKQAIDRIETRRDQYLYRQAFDHAQRHPDDVAEIARRLQEYLQESPNGRFAPAAREYIAWWEKIATAQNYTVTLKRAIVDSSFTKSMSGGAPDLAVTFWVGATKYGPSPVIPNRTNPIWNYTFPQPVQWRYGDPVTIQIVDTDWSDSVVATLHSARGDKLAMRNLSGQVRPEKQRGRILVEFSSPFSIPKLPSPTELARR